MRDRHEWWVKKGYDRWMWMFSIPLGVTFVYVVEYVVLHTLRSYQPPDGVILYQTPDSVTVPDTMSQWMQYVHEFWMQSVCSHAEVVQRLAV